MDMFAPCRNRYRIVHVSADFPDAIDPRKTKAISTLLALTEEHLEHEVISLNRTSPAMADLPGLLLGRNPIIDIWRQDDALASVRYRAPAKGWLHRTMLLRLADSLHDRLANGRPPHLIVGYKLTVEGIVVAEVAQRTGIPYALMIQGDTDTKILSARADLRRSYARIFHDAALVLALAPWSLTAIERQLGKRQGPSLTLPCPIALDRPLPPREAGRGLLTAFHLRNYRRKNLPRLAAALSSAKRTAPDLYLGLVGDGDSRSRADVERIGATTPGLILEGPIANEKMPDRYNDAIGFVMPSLRESFGMVFLEALFSGCPVVYPAGRSIDGYFDDIRCALPVVPTSTEAIAEAMVRLVHEERALKRALGEWQESPAARAFQRDTIASAFLNALRGAIERDEYPNLHRARFPV